MLFHTVNSTKNIPPSPSGWANSPQFKRKYTLVDQNGLPVAANYNGPKCILIAKRVHDFTKFERFLRAALGVVISPAALCYKPVKNWVHHLFTQKKIRDFYGIKVNFSVPQQAYLEQILPVLSQNQHIKHPYLWRKDKGSDKAEWKTISWLHNEDIIENTGGYLKPNAPADYMIFEGWYDPFQHNTLSAIAAITPDYIKDLENDNFSFKKILADWEKAGVSDNDRSRFKSAKQFIFFAQHLAIESLIEQFSLPDLEALVDKCQLANPSINKEALLADINYCKTFLEDTRLWSLLLGHQPVFSDHEENTYEAVKRLRDSLFLDTPPRT